MNSDLPNSWIALTSTHQLTDLVRQSFITPVIIFKYSNRCSISDIAFQRLLPKSTAETTLAQRVPCYFLDLFKYSPLSHLVAREFKVYHESPQLLLIKDGACVYESSHLDIKLSEMEEQLALVTEPNER